MDASFQFYGQLELVDFSNNQMASLPDRCFAKQSKLTHLKMDFNQIGNVTNATFLGLRSLTHLSLRGNRLASIDGRGIASLNEVSKKDPASFHGIAFAKSGGIFHENRIL